MKNKVVKTQNSRHSCIGYDDQWLMISSEQFQDDFQSLLHLTKSFHKSGTNGYAKIDLNSIKKIQYHENHTEFFIKYISPKSLKLKKYHFSIDNDDIRKQFCTSLAKDCVLTTKTERVNPFARLKLNLLFAFLTMLFTYTLYYISNGGLIHSRRATAQLVAEIVQYINPTIILFAGGISIIYFLYKIVLDYCKPTKTIKYN